MKKMMKKRIDTITEDNVAVSSIIQQETFSPPLPIGPPPPPPPNQTFFSYNQIIKKETDDGPGENFIIPIIKEDTNSTFNTTEKIICQNSSSNIMTKTEDGTKPEKKFQLPEGPIVQNEKNENNAAPDCVPAQPKVTPDAKPVCKDFLRGQCSWPHCIYRHEFDVTKLNKPTFCYDYQNKGCYDPRCKYVHASIFEQARFHKTGVLPDVLKQSYQALLNYYPHNVFQTCTYGQRNNPYFFHLSEYASSVSNLQNHPPFFSKPPPPLPPQFFSKPPPPPPPSPPTPKPNPPVEMPPPSPSAKPNLQTVSDNITDDAHPARLQNKRRWSCSNDGLFSSTSPVDDNGAKRMNSNKCYDYGMEDILKFVKETFHEVAKGSEKIEEKLMQVVTRRELLVKFESAQKSDNLNEGNISNTNQHFMEIIDQTDLQQALQHSRFINNKLSECKKILFQGPNFPA